MKPKPRFLKWDFDTDTVIEYERQGECNLCGQCCMALIVYKWAGKLSSRFAPMGNTTDEKGIWSEFMQGRIRRYIRLLRVSRKGNHVCPSYEFSGCVYHAEKSTRMRGKLALCAAWPVIPEHVAAFKECSYSFVEIGRWKISELNMQETERTA